MVFPSYPFRIQYQRNLRHAYAKIEDGQVLLLIPASLADDGDFLLKMQHLGEKVWLRYQKKVQYEIFTREGVLLFGERVPREFLQLRPEEKWWDAFLKAELRSYANPILQSLATQLGFSQVPLRIQQVKSQWWSCSFDNRIMLNRALVFLPTRLIQYVIVHEACHLVHKHHQKSFWSLVERYAPDYKRLRKELKNLTLLDGNRDC